MQRNQGLIAAQCLKLGPDGGLMLKISAQRQRKALDWRPMGARCISFAPDGGAMLWISEWPARG
jgi:hypothetical protein